MRLRKLNISNNCLILKQIIEMEMPSQGCQKGQVIDPGLHLN